MGTRTLGILPWGKDTIQNVTKVYGKSSPYPTPTYVP